MVTIDRLTTSWNGISSDTKPNQNVRNGSKYREMDTSRTYMFDEESQMWLIFKSGTDITSNKVGIGAVGFMVI